MNLMSSPVGVVGLGIMGGAMARNLLADGVPVFGFDIAEAACRSFVQAGGTCVPTAAAVARAAPIVITSLPSGASLASVVGGPEGLQGAGRSGLIVIETSTLALVDKEAALRTLRACGAVLLDCPISGTGAQAPPRDLVFLASGDAAAISQVRPILARLARTVHEVGPFGAGSRLKYIANLLVGIHNVAAAEAFVLAEKAGLDTQLVYNVLSDSAASSRVLQLRMPLMVANRYAPPTAEISTFVKDLEVIEAFANELESSTPLLGVVRRLYDRAVELGMGDLDSAAVCVVIEKLAGVARGPSLLEARGGDAPDEVALEDEVEQRKRD